MGDITWKTKEETVKGKGQKSFQNISRITAKENANRQIDRNYLGMLEENINHTSRFHIGTPVYLVDNKPLHSRYFIENRNNKMVQMQRINKIDEPELTYSNVPTTGQPKLPKDNNCPTIIFESMGNTIKDCDDIFQETLKYRGNTICVFGLNLKDDVNRKKNIDSLKSKFGDWKKRVNSSTVPNNNKGGQAWRNARRTQNMTNDTPCHLLYIFPFVWKALSPKQNGGYEMPYVEARLTVMGYAAEIVKKLENNQNPFQNKFLYRWIDADARNDTTNTISFSLLNSLANDTEAKVLSGRYNWGHEIDVGQKNTYHKFIVQLNIAEKKLRDYYHLLAKRSPDKNTDIPNVFYESPDTKNNFLPGYYLPETTLIMNQTAHETLLERNFDFSNIRRQDKESMWLISQLISSGNMTTSGIIYETKLSVQKPLKKELGDGTYLGKEMLTFLKSKILNRQSSMEETFIIALKNLRQSAFKNWYFLRDSYWDQWEKWSNREFSSLSFKKSKNHIETLQNMLNIKKVKLEKKLWKFLNKEYNENDRKTILGYIRDELN